MLEKNYADIANTFSHNKLLYRIRGICGNKICALVCVFVCFVLRFFIAILILRIMLAVCL